MNLSKLKEIIRNLSNFKVPLEPPGGILNLDKFYREVSFIKGQVEASKNILDTVYKQISTMDDGNRLIRCSDSVMQILNTAAESPIPIEEIQVQLKGKHRKKDIGRVISDFQKRGLLIENENGLIWKHKAED